MKDPTKKVLMSVSDGPEGIELYTSEERAVVDWSSEVPALYADVALQGAHFHVGPFQLITKRVEEELSARAALRALIDRLDLVHEDERYKSVWMMYMIHGGRYDGPTYEQELRDAKRALGDQP
jgi:hypothetical protein